MSDDARQVPVKLTGITQKQLIAQADAVGANTMNQWSGMILATMAPLPPAVVLKLLGKALDLQRTPNARVSD